jgi:gliding motility-associated-like protein
MLLVVGLAAQNIVTEDTFVVTVNNCNDEAMVCLDIALEDSDNYSFTADGTLYEGSISGCDFDTLFNYDYSTLFGQGNQGPYMLNSWTVNGETFSGQFQNVEELTAKMNEWNPAGNWMLSTANTNIIGGETSSTYGMLNITVMANGTPALLGFNYNITSEGIALQFPVGVHNVIATDNTTGETDDFTVTVSCQAIAETVDVNVMEGQSETVCLDFSELMNGEANTVMVGCDSGNDGIADLGLINSGTCVEITGLAVGAETACFIATDAAGNQDTTYFNVNVLPIMTMPVYLNDVIPANQEVYQVCLDTLELPGTVVSIENICEEESGEFVSFTLDEDTYCVKYAGLECDGIENACILICDNLGICDTTFIEITVDNTVCQPEPEYINNTIYQGQFFEYCFDVNDLPGTLETIENVCEDSDFVEFTLDEDSYCVTYEGIEVGQDNACFVVTDDLGNTDTTYFNINVITPIVETVILNQNIGDEETFCPSTEELPGNEYTIFNICEESSGENVIFNIDDVSLCLNTTALSIGTDTACIVICDENLICDTTFYHITVEEDNTNVSNIPPVAVDDEFSTSENIPLVLNVLGNDTIPAGSQIVVYTLPEAGGGVPTSGTPEANQDGTITYTPEAGYCGEDMFNYVLCNQFGCDTALVVLTIDCVTSENAEIVVHNGFSPNGDNINDTFMVSGLENFSKNTLKILNRWGTVVFSTSSYRNNWNGEWEGETLPDGTYFYLLTVEDVGNYQGYLQIQR